MVNKKIVPMSFSDDLFKHVDPVQRQANAIPSLLGMTLYSYTGVISRDQLSRNQLSRDQLSRDQFSRDQLKFSRDQLMHTIIANHAVKCFLLEMNSCIHSGMVANQITTCN